MLNTDNMTMAYFFSLAPLALAFLTLFTKALLIKVFFVKQGKKHATHKF